jgi:hypothetical protein
MFPASSFKPLSPHIIMIRSSSGVAEDLMMMTREKQALTSELLVVEDKMI